MLDWLMGSSHLEGARLFAVAYLIRNRSAGSDVLSILVIIATSPDEATGKAFRRIQEYYPADGGWDTPRIDVTEISRRLIDQVR